MSCQTVSGGLGVGLQVQGEGLGVESGGPGVGCGHPESHGGLWVANLRGVWEQGWGFRRGWEVWDGICNDGLGAVRSQAIYRWLLVKLITY